MRQKYKIEILVDYDWDEDKIKESLKIMDFGISSIKKIPNRRTLSQNRTFHGWLGVVGNNAKEKGLTVSVLYKEPTEILITPEILKGYAQEVIGTSFGIKSTSKLNTKQFSAMIEFLEDKFATDLDSQIPFDYKKEYAEYLMKKYK